MNINLSLRGRIQWSFIIATLIILVTGFRLYYHLDTINKNLERITSTTQTVNVLSDEIRISAVEILKVQKKIITKKANEEDLKKLVILCEGFQSQLQQLETYYTDEEVRKIITKMTSYVETLGSVVAKISVFDRESVGLSTVGELSDKILESFSQFQDRQYIRNETRDKQIKQIIADSRKQMLITLILAFLGCILISLVIPGKIALPFKKLTDAIHELQECNFDVSIYYNQDDEIGELAHEINKMITSLKKFEELRTDRISLEHRKFDALANMVKKNVLVANARGEIVYINNNLYSVLQVQSDDIIHKNVNEAPLSESIVDAYNLAIKRRSKIENIEVEITPKVVSEMSSEETEESVEDRERYSFKGYATIIPIRGKQSAEDHYLMVLSKEVFS